ncbi:MAG TPA: hypothetical protein VLQ94_02860, partial [Candidatus Binatia bacterium]|nr:hypothetical protein [Candidatus Binatia bacterium]
QPSTAAADMGMIAGAGPVPPDAPLEARFTASPSHRAPAGNAHHRGVVTDGELARTGDAAMLSPEEFDQAGFAHVPQE